MSSVARWSYTGTATVYPKESLDDFTGEKVLGAPYPVACTWVGAGGEVQRDSLGTEFVTKTKIWCEDPRPMPGDEIEIPGIGRDVIRGRRVFDMSPFGEPDSPDFELSTGAGVP